ncbi:hypothetical protein WDJ51_13475 [Rathayibacter sp. YIM 133350]|uniref:hypothetical protein n=1 Tax=Rathayibacter sp. YIM 133350 TaxID=3131992 RepID=UPI00307F94ED
MPISSVSFWVCAVVTLLSALVSGAYALAGARSASTDTRAPSLYALARSAALLVVAVVAVFTASVAFQSAVAIAMIIVQAGDAIIGGLIHDRVKTLGPAVVAVANALALVWMLAS